MIRHTRRSRPPWTPQWDQARARRLPAGLIERGTAGTGLPPAGWYGTTGTAGPITGLIVDIDWDDLQPGTTYDPAIGTNAARTKLDDAITFAKDTCDPPLGIRFRPKVGGQAPSWVRDAAGTVTMGNGGADLPTPPFWVVAYRDALRAFYRRVRALPATIGGTFGDHIDDIVVAGCNSFFSEPMLIRPDNSRADGKPNDEILYEAGLRGVEHEAAFRALVELHAEEWPEQYLYLACSPFQRIKDGVATAPYFTTEVSASQRLIEHFRWRAGRRAVIGHNAWGFDRTRGMGNAGYSGTPANPPVAGGNHGTMLDWMRGLGPPGTVQTAASGNDKLGDLERAIHEIQRYGWQGCELPSGSTNGYASARIGSATTTGTASASSSGTTFVASSGTPFATTNNPVSQTVLMTSGAASGQARLIVRRLDNDSLQVELESPFSPDPSAGDTFELRRAGFAGADGGTGGVARALIHSRQLSGR